MTENKTKKATILEHDECSTDLGKYLPPWMKIQLSNNKLWNRAVIMLTQELGIGNEEALTLIKKHRSIKKAIKAYEAKKTISS